MMSWTPEQRADFQSRGIQIDAQGRPFGIRTDPGHAGEKLYFNPEQLSGMGGTTAHRTENWDGKTGQWVAKPTDQLNKWLIGATVAGLTAGVASAAGAFAGAGGGGTSAATTSATTAGGSTVAGGSVPIASVVSPHWWSSAWLPSAINAGAGLVASRQASNANKDAARLEYEATQQALADAREQRDYEQQRDEEQQQYDRTRYGEERDYNRAQYGEVRDYDRGQYANYLGRLDPYRQTGNRALTRVEDVLNSSRPMNPAAGGNPAAMSGGTVRLKAPTGEVKDVPAEMAEQFLNRGAIRV